ncbi:MAG: pectate lyase [Prevotella sp.]|nr:pectate lyase [Prevotella sp.]
MLFAALLTLGAWAQTDDAPAFPGAEGHGRYVTGGRGGEVRHVTTLEDNGSTSLKGSLRWAVNGSAKKIVVFDVAGVIALTKDLSIGQNTTIEGQTAPYPGITVRYYTVQAQNNCIIRFMRFRRGDEKDINDGADAIWRRESTGIIIDHCSMSWSIDEVASFYDNNNFTLQWCTVAEALVHPGHTKGPHGYGGIWGGKLASFHHNLIAHVDNRSPRFNGARYEWTGYTKNLLYDDYQWENAVQAENVDLRNCVIYNCGNGCYGGPGGGYVNMVNNYFKTGPAKKTNYLTTVSVGASGNSTPTALQGMTSRYYIEGNMIEGNNSVNNNNWNGVTYDNGTFTIDGQRYSKDPNHYFGSGVEYKQNSSGVDCVSIKVDESEAAPTGDITTHSAEQAFSAVLNYAGASLYRDEVDARYMEETENGTCTYNGTATSYVKDGKTYNRSIAYPGRIDHVSDVNGYTEENFPTGNRPNDWDTDNDGMPDAWETANGLNPNDATDAQAYTLDSKGWYTNVEVYCNAIVEDIMKGGNDGADEPFDDYYPESVQPTAISLQNAPMSEVTKIEYFTLDGAKISQPERGISIRKMTMRNGQTLTQKVVK